MARSVCNTCSLSAFCLPGGFYKLYADEFRKRIRSTYIRAKAHAEPKETTRLRIATDSAAMQAAQTFPRACPEAPHGIQPVVEEFDFNNYDMLGRARGMGVVRYRIGTEIFEVSLA